MRLRFLTFLASALVTLSFCSTASAASTPSTAAAPDTTPPKLELIIPKVTNAPSFDLLGRTEPDAKVQINGLDVSVKPQSSAGMLAVLSVTIVTFRGVPPRLCRWPNRGGKLGSVSQIPCCFLDIEPDRTIYINLAPRGFFLLQPFDILYNKDN